MSYTYATSNYERSEKARQELFIEQKEKCKCCNERLEYFKSKIEHNHETDQIRGLVCSRCNLAIMARERGLRSTLFSFKIMKAVELYLRESA